MRVWISRYQLQPRASLNSLAGASPRHGALLKVESEAGAGYADLHPWPELGDEPLEAQLEALKAGTPKAVGARSVQLAAADAAARARGVSLFAECGAIPESHHLVSDLKSFDPAQAQGFSHLKLKLGRELDEELATIKSKADVLSQFALRFDFNAVLSAGRFLAFAEKLPKEVFARVEFVEDPIPFAPDDWITLHDLGKLPLALDRWPPRGEPSARGYTWLVYKPATHTPEAISKLAGRAKARLAVTSYMDHPLGQCSAAWEAARLNATGVVGICGLLTHSVFEANAYSEKLGSQGSRFQAPAGTGFGFDELLAKEEWKEL